MKLKKLKFPAGNAGNFSKLLFFLVILAAVFIVPPFLSGLRKAAKAGGSVLDTVAGGVEGVSEFAKRALSDLGIGKSPFADQVYFYMHPPAGSYWNPNYWEGKMDQKMYTDTIASLDYWGPIYRDKMLGWLGYDLHANIQLIESSIGSKVGISLFQWWHQKKYGESFVHYLNVGWWLKMSDKDTVTFCQAMDSLPEFP